MVEATEPPTSLSTSTSTLTSTLTSTNPAHALVETSRKRYLFGDVHIWDLNDNKNHIPLGGLVTAAGVTHTDFFQMLEILLVIDGDYVVQNEQGDEVVPDDQPLLPGDYTIAADSIRANDEPVHTRSKSTSTGTDTTRAQQLFEKDVQARDGGCVVSKVVNARAPQGIWSGFEAAHIFPPAHEQEWLERGYDQSVTVDPPEGEGSKINSVQNGILLTSYLHELFADYSFSINPDAV